MKSGVAITQYNILKIPSEINQGLIALNLSVIEREMELLKKKINGSNSFIAEIKVKLIIQYDEHVSYIELYKSF